MVSGQSLTTFRKNLRPSGTARKPHHTSLPWSACPWSPAGPCHKGRGEAASSGDVGADVRSRSLKGERMRTRDRQDLGEGRDDVLKLSSAETRV